MQEVTDEPLYRDRVCGIDIGKAGLAATIRVPSDRDPARRAAETRSFGTTKKEVLALADWLRSWQVPAVVMEATGDYWKGPFYRLEAEGESVRKIVRGVVDKSVSAGHRGWPGPWGGQDDDARGTARGSRGPGGGIFGGRGWW